MTFTLTRTTSSDPRFHALVAELDADLRVRYGAVQDQYAPLNKLPEDNPAVVAHDGDHALGCCSFKSFDGDAIEIKRMFVTAAARRRGVAQAVLAEIEAWGRERGFTAAVLETGTLQHEAIALYARCGYATVPLFPPYVGMPASVCMRKPL